MGLQFFGRVDIAGDTGVMTVSLMGRADATVFVQDLTPERA